MDILAGRITGGKKMRISHKELKAFKPKAEYVKLELGEPVIVRLYEEPVPCVSVEKAETKSCYPLSDEDYNLYMLEWECMCCPSAVTYSDLAAIYKERKDMAKSGKARAFCDRIAAVYDGLRKEVE